MLFDLNSFFASCEQQENSALRGKPLAVIPTLSDSTSVIAASYEAKKFGIKTGTKVSDAKKMCPNLLLKVASHKLYTEYHHKIIKAVHEIIPIEKVLSIDEVACRFMGREQVLENAISIAKKVKAHVKAVVGSEINSSIGLGPNILIAKIASDLQKPDGLIAITKESIPEKLGPLPIEVISGIGQQMKIRLNQKGFFNINDLLKVSPQELKKNWGSIYGLRIAEELRGENLAWRAESIQKSISHQHVLPPDLRNFKNSYEIAVKLLMKAVVRLRKEKLKAQSVSVYVKFLNGQRFENSISFQQTDDVYFLVKQLKLIWHLQSTHKPIKVAVVLGELTEGPDQLSFFDNPKSGRMNEAMDSINQKFGANTLFLAQTKDVINYGKSRISFNHIPELDDEF